MCCKCNVFNLMDRWEKMSRMCCVRSETNVRLIDELMDWKICNYCENRLFVRSSFMIKNATKSLFPSSLMEIFRAHFWVHFNSWSGSLSHITWSSSKVSFVKRNLNIYISLTTGLLLLHMLMRIMWNWWKVPKQLLKGPWGETVLWKSSTNFVGQTKQDIKDIWPAVFTIFWHFRN